MTANLIDGKRLASNLLQSLSDKIAEYKERTSLVPGLGAILVGDDPPSQLYVKKKQEACDRVGIRTLVARLPSTTTKEELFQVIDVFNNDKTIHGILLQLPLPKHLSTQEALSRIRADKDVDGLTPYQQGCLAWRFPAVYPCTAIAVMHLIKYVHRDLKGKLAAVIGLSPLAGLSISSLLVREKATVIEIHSDTLNPHELCKQADIIVSCTGRKGLITSPWVKKGATVIDVGIARHEGKVYGDVDFQEVSPIAGHITPVPGGVGPVTIAMLALNTFDLFLRITSHEKNDPTANGS